jgi:hypothetical protein
METKRMRRREKAAEHPGSDTPAWAQRLAHRRKAEEIGRETAAEEKDWTPSAITMLWAMFDEAVEQANGALERSGAVERILLHRTMREYRLSMMGREGEERQIAVFASLVSVGGRPSGGALITTNQTRASIVLVASLTGRRVRWTISESGTAFSERVIGDLFLSVFSDDPAATRRLSSHFSLTP